MKKLAVVAVLLVCGVAFADGIPDTEPPNEMQPAKVSTVALNRGVDECVAGVQQASPNSPSMVAAKYCNCGSDFTRSSVRDNAKKLTELFANFDPSTRQKQMEKCVKWGNADINNDKIAVDSPYSKTLDLPTEVIVAAFNSCSEALRYKSVPKDARAAYCGCTTDAMRAQAAAKLAKIRKARGEKLETFVPADNSEACAKTHDITETAPP